MRIGGLEPFSLSDYPGRTAAVIFTQGCNFRCPFCHNGQLIGPADNASDPIAESYVLDFLRRRRGRLDGVVLSGGEPTLQPDLANFARQLKVMGFLVKLDTNGSRPDVVEHLLANDLVDYIAMDVKAPPKKYDRLVGGPVDVACIRRSIEIIAASGVEHEFRTTMVEPLLSPADLRSLQRLMPPGSRHKLQTFRPENALDATLRAGRVLEPVPSPVKAVTTHRRRSQEPLPYDAGR